MSGSIPSHWTSRFEVLDRVPSGAMVLTCDLRVAYWNRCLEHWTGVDRQRIVGSVLTDRYPHLGEAKYLARFRSVFHGGPPTVFSSQLHGQLIPSRLRNGKPRVQHTTVTAIQQADHGGTPGGPEHLAMFDIRDVTDHAMQVRAYREACERAIEEVKRREVAERRLADTNAQLVVKNGEIQAFAHTCSHDLKSPLWTVKGYCKLLLGRTETFADPDDRDCVERIMSGVERMAMMVDGLLGYAMAGNARGRCEQVDLGQLVAVVLEGLTKNIERSGADVRVEGELPVVPADRVGLQQVLANLINNAIKFTDPDRGIRVRIGADRTDQGWEIWVRDSGIGIAPKFHDVIFEPFKRLHSVGEYEGSGIGLAACQRAVQRHGGKIWVKSSPGEGSEFRFSLPTNEAGQANTGGRDDGSTGSIGADNADAA